jgi:hypothetical protein
MRSSSPSYTIISDKYPFTPSLDKLVEHHRDIGQHKAAYVEAEELGGVAGRELEADVCGRRMLEAWVFDLASNLVCSPC